MDGTGSRPYSVCTSSSLKQQKHNQLLIDPLPQAVDISANLHNKVTKSRDEMLRVLLLTDMN